MSARFDSGPVVLTSQLGVEVAVSEIQESTSVHFSVVGGVAIARAMPAFCYGNPIVAARMVNSTTPATKLTAVHFGDSLAAQSASLRDYETVGFGIPWGGTNLALVPLAAGAPPWINTVYAALANNVPTPTPIDGTIGHFAPTGAIRTAFSVGVSPIWTNNRFLYSAAIQPNLWLATTQFIGKTCYFRELIRCGPFGTTVADCRLGWRPSTLGEVGFTDLAIMTHGLTESTNIFSVAVPAAFDWVTNPIIYFEVRHIGNTATRAEDWWHLDLLFESEQGVTHYNTSVGGRSGAGYLDPDVFGPEVYAEFLPLLSGEKMLWISLGTNGTLTLAQLQQMTANFRAFEPNALVLLDTGYNGAAGIGLAKRHREVMRAFIELEPRSLMVDTLAALGDGPGLVASGFFNVPGNPGDSTHADPDGRQRYFAKLSELVALAALTA